MGVNMGPLVTSLIEVFRHESESIARAKMAHMPCYRIADMLIVDGITSPFTRDTWLIINEVSVPIGWWQRGKLQRAIDKWNEWDKARRLLNALAQPYTPQAQAGE